MAHALKEKLTHGLGWKFLKWPFFESDIPDRFLVHFTDIWPGCPDQGMMICEGALPYRGDSLPMRKDFWAVQGKLPVWGHYIHGFAWLRDLRAVGTAKAAELGRAMVLDWISASGPMLKDEAVRQKTGERLNMWMAHYDFFFAAAGDNDDEQYFKALTQQAELLSGLKTIDYDPVERFHTAKAFILCGLALKGYEGRIEHGLAALKKELKNNLYEDTVPVSRNPETLLQILQILLDVRIALQAGGYPEQSFLEMHIQDCHDALKVFQTQDKGLFLINAAQEGTRDWIDSALNQSRSGRRVAKSLKPSGFERMSMGRSLILFNKGQPAQKDSKTANPLHDAPLSFEYCYGKDRVFVNCGTHPTCPEWQSHLQTISAHNCLSIRRPDDQNIKLRKPKPMPYMASLSRQDQKKTQSITAEQNRYEPLYGLTHARSITLDKQGGLFEGRDSLTPLDLDYSYDYPLDIVIRFHLHPQVLVSLIHDETQALLRLPNGIGFRFAQDGGALALENSIYLGEGIQPRKTKQLVIYGQYSAGKKDFNWNLIREGL